MNIFEADYGLGPLKDVEEVIRVGFDNLFERNKKEPWFDGYWMNEYGEVLFGTLLVACQAYCLQALSDINEVRGSLGLDALSKLDAYKMHHGSKRKHSAIELINSAANCFKHRDEWAEIWPDNITTKTLAYYSITSDCEYPLNEAREVIETELGYDRLYSLVSEWRKELISNSKKES